MLDQVARVDNEALQFDQAIAGSSGASAEKPAVTCAACRAQIETEYFDVNGHSVCGRCRTIAASAAETPRGIVPLATAAAYGLGAGILGAIVYYAVIAIAHLEIGIVAILIGYMVGYAVRAGARGRGALRFQVLAVCLTYGSIALAYTPIAIKEMAAGRKAPGASAASSSDAAAADADLEEAAPSAGRMLLFAAALAGFIAALPILVVVGSFPSGLISALIIFFGMRQAWRMTGPPRMQILGPYRVGALPRPASA